MLRSPGFLSDSQVWSRRSPGVFAPDLDPTHSTPGTTIERPFTGLCVSARLTPTLGKLAHMWSSRVSGSECASLDHIGRLLGNHVNGTPHPGLSPYLASGTDRSLRSQTTQLTFSVIALSCSAQRSSSVAPVRFRTFGDMPGLLSRTSRAGQARDANRDTAALVSFASTTSLLAPHFPP